MRTVTWACQSERAQLEKQFYLKGLGKRMGGGGGGAGVGKMESRGKTSRRLWEREKNAQTHVPQYSFLRISNPHRVHLWRLAVLEQNFASEGVASLGYFKVPVQLPPDLSFPKKGKKYGKGLSMGSGTPAYQVTGAQAAAGVKDVVKRAGEGGNTLAGGGGALGWLFYSKDSVTTPTHQSLSDSIESAEQLYEHSLRYTFGDIIPNEIYKVIV